MTSFDAAYDNGFHFRLGHECPQFCVSNSRPQLYGILPLLNQNEPICDLNNCFRGRSKLADPSFKEYFWCQSKFQPSDRHLSAKLLATFADKECHVVSVTYPYGRILGFVDRSRYFFQVAPQLFSRGWVDPVPDPKLFRKSGSAGNRTRASRSVARNSYH
jgi:hypothetical protein